MKKIVAITSALLMMLSAGSLAAVAEDAPAKASVYVTIADKDGKLAMTQQAVTVTDADGDNALTINDALIAAHEASYPGGAAAGYASENTTYGLSMTKLWGTANGGGYGYYVNNAAAWSLADAVKDGDYVNAFVYTDLTGWSDAYTFFDVHTVSTKTGAEVTLTLSAAGYDADYNPLTLPVKNATITLDGAKTAFKTDANGHVTLTLDAAGTHVISAVSDTDILVPPVCVATVEATATSTTTSTTPSAGESTTTAADVTEADTEPTDADNTTDAETIVTDANDSNDASPSTGDTTPVTALALTVISLAGVLVLASKRAKANEQ